MKKKAIAIPLIVLLILALVFAACTAAQQTAAEGETDVAVTEPVTVEAPEEALVSFEVTDAQGNVLSLIPIYDADAVTVIAGYVESAVDKDGNALTAEQLPAIGSLIGVTVGEEGITADVDDEGNLLIIESYADESGNLLALKDVKDLNQNADKEEYLKLNLVTDANGLVHYMVEYTAVSVTKKQNGTATVVIDGEKKKAAVVNADNTAVAEKIAEDKKQNETQQKENEQKASTTTTTTTTQPTTEEPTSEQPSEEDPTAPAEPKLGIVLLANRTAQSDADGVEIATGSVTITKPGDYEITSDTDVWHGQIIVKLPNTEKAEIAFRNVNIQNNTTNIIQLLDTSIDEDRSFLEAESGLDEYASDYVEMLSEYDLAPNVQLSFPEGTASTFVTTANSHTGVLYNESKLTIKGHGSAEFSSLRNPNNGICSTKSIKIRNVSLRLTTPQSESTSVLDKATGSAKGIFSYSRVTVESGNISINTNGDGIRCQKLEIQDGTVNIASSACDGIDADDMITINSGNIKVTALQKHAFKVRRINNTEKGYVKGRARPEKGDTFEINGGTVIGESKRITTVQPSSSQVSLSCRIVKPSAGSDAALQETKTPAYISIDGVKSSANKCIKFLYSSSSLSQGAFYTVSTGDNMTQMTDADWNGSVGTIRVISVQ